MDKAKSPNAQYLSASPDTSVGQSVPNSGRSSRMSFKGKYGGSPRPATGNSSPRRLSQQIALESLSSPPQGALNLSSSISNEIRPTAAPSLTLDASSLATPFRQKAASHHGSPTASALKAKKRSNFSSLLSSGGGLYGNERLLDSGTKFPALLESIADYRACCQPLDRNDEARLDPTQTVALQCAYNVEDERDILSYSRDEGEVGRISATLTVTGHQVIDTQSEMGRYSARHDPNDDGACGCTETEIVKNDRGMDYSRYHTHSLFKECHMCKRQPATFLCLTSLNGCCASHVEENYARDNANSLYINLMDITTSYDRMFWCEKCKRFTWKYTDVYEAFTDQLAYTKGTYWASAIRDIAATAYHMRCNPTTPNSYDGLHLCAVAASAQGWRSSQEDAESAFLLRVPCFGTRQGIEHMCVFAVFDGHGGDAVARIASSVIEHTLQRTLTTIAKERRSIVPDELEDIRNFYIEVFETALMQLDADIRNSEEGKRGDYNCVGSTACIVGITNSYIVCANLGDSGAALYSRHDPTLVPLSHAHRLTDTLESDRVLRAGYNIRDGRIEGLLAVPRALGDYDFKQTRGGPKEQAVISCPTVKTVRTPPSFSHRQRDDGSTPIPWGMLIACDGVWDTLSLKQVSKVTSTFSLRTAALVHEEFETGAIPPCLPEPLIPNLLRVYSQCIAPTNNEEGVGVDNVSAIFVEPCPLAPRRTSCVGLT